VHGFDKASHICDQSAQNQFKVAFLILEYDAPFERETHL